MLSPVPGDHDRPWIPLGYMLKTVAPGEAVFPEGRVRAIGSMSGCISAVFGDYARLWRHNGYWLFDTIADVEEAAAVLGGASSILQAFYYSAWPEEFDPGARTWRPFLPAAGLAVQVAAPEAGTLWGYDVVGFSAGAAPECSPLSCNGLAAELSVNEKCLFDSFAAAKAALESGAFDRSEPGPFRIVAVYGVARTAR